MDTPTLTAALAAGAFSVVSPGVVPLLPGFLAFTRRRGAGHILAFLMGSAAVFVLLGASATGAGQWLLENLAGLEMAAGVMLVALGVRATGLLTRSRFGEHARQRETPATIVEALIAGAALTFGWTPLGGDTLQEIFAISTSPDSIALGMSLLVMYATGRAVSCLVLALALRAAVPARVPGRWLDLIAGGVMIATGLLVFTGAMPALAAALSGLLPHF